MLPGTSDWSDRQTAMLDHAAAALKSNEAMALLEFNDLNNKEFHNGDLYVVCYNISSAVSYRVESVLRRRASASRLLRLTFSL
jgi:hypothetical protein